MYAKKFLRLCGGMLLLAVLLVAVPQEAAACNQGPPDCRQCDDVECTVDEIKTLAIVTAEQLVCYAHGALFGPGMVVVCEIVVNTYNTVHSEIFEDCSEQDRCYDECGEDYYDGC